MQRALKVFFGGYKHVFFSSFVYLWLKDKENYYE